MSEMAYKIPPHFEGMHGNVVLPSFSVIGAHGLRVTAGQAKAHIKRLYESGRANHSGQGGMVWVSLLALHYNKTPYTMKVVPGMGFEVTIDPPFQGEAA